MKECKVKGSYTVCVHFNDTVEKATQGNSNQLVGCQKGEGNIAVAGGSFGI